MIPLDLELVAHAIGHEPRAWQPHEAGGYTSSRAWRVDTLEGPVFAKQAEDAGALHMLRREALVYRSVRGPFLARLVGFADAGDRALLALEFLEGARWPPPYPEDVGPLFAALELVAGATPPRDLPAQRPRWSRWERVAIDPEPFLTLGLCSRHWLDDALDALVTAEAQAVFEGEGLVHNDVYSGNVCFTRRGAVLVDWGAAVRGSRCIDLAFAALSVRVEGGTMPPLDFPATSRMP